MCRVKVSCFIYLVLGSNRRYQCPLCLRSLFKMNWAILDEDILNNPLPHHLRNFMVQVRNFKFSYQLAVHIVLCAQPQISCHDCLAKSDTSFHDIGLKCASCGSYNTVRCGHEELPKLPPSAAKRRQCIIC